MMGSVFTRQAIVVLDVGSLDFLDEIARSDRYNTRKSVINRLISRKLKLVQRWGGP